MTPLQTIYLDWVNNFLSVECFARYYMIPEKDAKQLIDICRNHHEDLVNAVKPDIAWDTPDHAPHNQVNQ